MDLTDDILSCISDGKNPFEFVFNNSMICMRYPYFIMTFRYIRYVLDVKYIPLTDAHPWKIWDNGYKQFKEQDRKMNRHAKAISYDMYKNRRLIEDADCFVPLRPIDEKPYRCRSPKERLEVDTTGLCVLRHDVDTNRFSIVAITDHLFDQDMNQDARLCHSDISPNHFCLTYNGFKENKVIMYYRALYIPDDFSYVYMYKEYPLISNPEPVEKNCVFVSETSSVLYWISPLRGMVVKNVSDELTHTFPTTWRLPSDLSSDDISFSLGTPAVNYKGRYIMAGHAKIAFRRNIRNSKWNAFSETLDWDRIKKHGSYVYMCFFIEFTKQFEITRVSDMFFPCYQDCTEMLPYVLTFPTGLCFHEDTCFLSYGEGDCRIKIWNTSIQRLEKRMIPVSQWTDSFQFFIWYEKEMSVLPKKRITHIGYFYEWNCGDDAFMTVFDYLYKKYYPSIDIAYRNTSSSDIYQPSVIENELTVIGGGDIINPFFLDRLLRSRSNIWAMGVGTPYTVFFSFIDKFDLCYSRNKDDVDVFRERFESPERFHYTPDLAFLLTDIFDQQHLLQPVSSLLSQLGFTYLPSVSNPSDDPQVIHHCIGLCLTRTMFSTGYEDDYIKVVTSVVAIIRNLLETIPHSAVFLIPFCIATNKQNENDCILTSHIKEFFYNTNRVIDVYHQDTTYDREAYVRQTFEWIKRMDMLIVQRFHSHVFALANHVPFISITSGRKCIEFCTQYGLTDYMVRLPVNDRDAPNDIPVSLVSEKCLDVWNRRNSVRTQLSEIHFTIMNDIRAVEEDWAERVKTHFQL